MSRQPSPDTPPLFWGLACLIVLAAAGGAALLWPSLLTYGASQSRSLVQAAGETSGSEAKADFQIATLLNPSNETAFSGLAQLEIAAGQPARALSLLSKAGSSTNVTALRVSTLVELGRYHEAADDALPLTADDASLSDLLLAAIANRLANRQTNIAPYTTRLNSPEAARALRRVQATDLPLAAQLYASGLPVSSSVILNTLIVSYERNLLLAKIQLAGGTSAQLSSAASLLETATTLNPAAREAHDLLAATYTSLGRIKDASTQSALSSRITTGRP